MASTHTVFKPIASDSLFGSIYIPSGNSVSYTGVTLYFSDSSYLSTVNWDDYIAELPDPAYADVINFGLSIMQSLYPTSENSDYYDASNNSSAFTKSVWSDGLYRYELSVAGGEDEKQWILYVPTVENKLKLLAQSVLNSQCNCSLDPALKDKFVKAKAYQELIYNKVINLTTDQSSVLEIQEVIDDIASDLTVLLNFLEGTETLCGC